MTLDLTPNEFVGFRIQPDFNNFKVVMVRRYGPKSSKAGQEYARPISYCKDIHTAAMSLFNYALRYRAEASQEEQALVDKSCADMTVLREDVKKATDDVRVALLEIQGLLKDLDLTEREALRMMSDQARAGKGIDEEEAEAE